MKDQQSIFLIQVEWQPSRLPIYLVPPSSSHHHPSLKVKAPWLLFWSWEIVCNFLSKFECPLESEILTSNIFTDIRKPNSMTSSFTVNSALKSKAISRLFSDVSLAVTSAFVIVSVIMRYPLGFPGPCRQGGFSGLIWQIYPNLLSPCTDWSFPWFYEKEVGITASLHVGFLYVKLSRGHLNRLLGLSPVILVTTWNPKLHVK